MYCVTNYKTKKALKQDVAAGKSVRIFQPGPFDLECSTGTVSLEGPHYPLPHKWYARAVIKDGIVVSVT